MANTRGDSPRLDADDSFDVGSRRLLTEAGEHDGLEGTLDRLLHRMNGSGEDAEEEYQRALGDVGKFGPDAVSAVAARLRLLPEEAYQERWFLVQALVDIGDPSGARLLGEILDTPIPPERTEHADHHFSTVGEEVIIRTTAIEGLSRLAERGDKGAVQSLERHATNEQRTVRRAALRALSVHDGEAAARLAADLPKDERKALQAGAVDVRSVPQPEEGLMVRRGLESRADEPPPPTLERPGRRDDDQRKG